VSLLVIGQTTVTPAIPTNISKWIFFGCIMVSFLFLIWDMIKARRTLATRDISFAFTSVIANNYLSMKDYRCYCLFKSINTNSKGIDKYAFFIFFTLKGWKRLLIAEAPRQIINVVTLEVLAPEWLKIHNGQVSFDNNALGETWMQQILTGTMAFSVLVFAINFILVCVATVLYIPLFCHIRGNLKEYCCHKVDKRIDAILRKQGQRVKNRNGMQAEEESFTDESYYKRPLAANYMNIGSPALSSAGGGQYEKLPLSQKFETASPMMSPSIQSQNISVSTPASKHLLLGNDQGYYEDYQTPPGRYMESDHIGVNSNGYFNQNYSPRPAQQLPPYENGAPNQPYASNNPSPMNSPASAQRTIGSPAPSSTCVNEQKYQSKKYPRQGN
jgi:hypothetical protein